MATNGRTDRGNPRHNLRVRAVRGSHRDGTDGVVIIRREEQRMSAEVFYALLIVTLLVE